MTQNLTETIPAIAFTDLTKTYAETVVLGPVSGAHFNPAVTLALALFRGFSWKKVLPYWGAQVIGGMVGAAIVYAVDDEEPTWPQIDEATADFRYARLMSSREDEPTGMTAAELDGVAKQAKAWAKRGDVFAYFISGAKVRNPAAAQALIAKLK